MLELDLSAYQDRLRVKEEQGKRLIWDGIRRKWLVLQPEEWVRQLMVHHLIDGLGYNRHRIKLEMGLTIHRVYRRCDILVYDEDVNPFLLVECKAPSIPVSEAVFRQIAHYNMALQVPYLWVGNGPVNYCCAIDFAQEDFSFLSDLPAYPGQKRKTDTPENP